MKISELEVGNQVNLEIVTGTSVFEVGTRVVGLSKDGSLSAHVLLQPFVYKGKMLDLGAHYVEGTRFNLYVDDKEGERVCWRDVHVQRKIYKDNAYYAVTPQHHHSLSAPSDRRANKRLKLDIPGIVKYAGGEEQVTIHDISANGVAFVAALPVRLIGTKCMVKFEEEINDTRYDLNIECKCVRAVDEANGYLYGCEVTEASNSMLAYVYIKKMLEKYEKTVANKEA